MGRSIQQAEEQYQEIRQAIDAFVKDNYYEAVYTVSAGILGGAEFTGFNFSDIMRYSEFSLNEAKRRGKNRAYVLEKQDYEIYAATLRERNRIAREIHDNVGHVLSRSILMTAACKTINKDESLDPLLGNLEESLNGAMNSIRSSVHDLHDDAVNLEDAIKGLVKDFSFCPVTLTYDMSRQVPREVKYSLISITKEGLSNVMRHSNADSVNILLREHPALYQLCIEDNGTLGHEIPDIHAETDSNKMENVSGGMGLSNIRDRVKALGGTVQITQEKGFRIFVTIPKSVSN